MRRLPLVALGVALGLLSACSSGQDVQWLAGPAWLDSQTLWVDAASPFVTFDGGSGSMVAGPGWAPPEGSGGPGDWGSYAWVTDTEATLWLTPPAGEQLDFYARCTPYPFEETDSPQVLTVVVDGQEVASTRLAPGWQEVRASLPRTPDPGGVQEIRLRFARTTKPSDLGDSADSRDLAAAVSVAAVVPSGVRDPAAFLDLQRLSSDRLTLPVGGAASLPLPASTPGSLHFGEVRSSCADCTATVDLLGPDLAARRVWEGELSDLSQASIAFETGGRGISRLLVRVSDPRGWRDGRIERVTFDLTDGFVELRPADPSPGAGRPSVFLYMVDTLRADVLATSGGPPDLAPRMNAFGEHGVVYQNARVASSWTLPSVVSILTGVYPFQHGVMRGDVKFDGATLPGAGRRLAALGYETVGISHSFVASQAFGIQTDFEAFFLSNHLNGRKLRSQTIRKMLLHWLLRPGRGGEPVYAYLHSVDPHAPYSPPEGHRELTDRTPAGLPAERYRPSVFMSEDLASKPEEVEHLRARYLDEVRYTDLQFGRFLDMIRWLGLYDDSLVVLVSDHGEEFAEHGGFDHGRTLYDELLRVPLIAKFPGDLWAGARVRRAVSTVDILPTVLELAGDGGAAGARPGVDLAPGPNGPDAPGRRAVFAEVNPAAAPHAGAVDLRALGVGRLKCIQNLDGVDQFGRPVPDWEVFDLRADPGEKAPLELGSSQARRCREALRRWLDAQQGARPGQELGDETSQDALDQLRALGYIE